MKDLMDQFSARFSDARAHKQEFELFGSPFDISIDDVPETVQMELIELQNNKIMRSKFQDKFISLLEFYHKYVQEAGSYENLIDHAKRMATIFGSTYVCEQLFSKMKFTKGKMRTQLTDAHLNGIFRVATSKLKPDISKLTHEKRHQVSH